MRKFTLFIPILLIGVILFRCSKIDIEEMSYPNSLTVNNEVLVVDSVSTRSKSLGIGSYKIYSRNTRTNEYKTDLINFEIFGKNGNKRVTTQITNNGILKIKPDKEDFRNLSLVELNLNNMSLTIAANNKEHILYLKNYYRNEFEYQKAREIFDNNVDEISILLSSSIDIINKYDMEVIGKRTSVSSPVVSYVEALCPAGSEFVTSTYYDLSKSVATTFSYNNLQGSVCSNAYCIGCVSTFGTDCLCILQDYGCACTSKGCACNEPVPQD